MIVSFTEKERKGKVRRRSLESVAEDVIQDVFVQFWHKREQIQYTTSVYSYLQRAVKNACINMRLHEDVERGSF